MQSGNYKHYAHFVRFVNIYTMFTVHQCHEDPCIAFAGSSYERCHAILGKTDGGDYNYVNECP